MTSEFKVLTGLMRPVCS